MANQELHSCTASFSRDKPWFVSVEWMRLESFACIYIVTEYHGQKNLSAAVFLYPDLPVFT